MFQLAIDISRLGPAAQKQIREKMAEKEKNMANTVRRYNMGGGDDPSHTKKNKLNAVKVDGYASKHEAERAEELRWLEKAGKIRDLKEQVKFVLIPAKWEETPRIGKRGKPIKPKRVCLQRELAYIADFCYTDCATGHTVVEDAKGYKGGATYRVFKDKAKMMYDKYGIKVVEV
jgi:hypothetical protein